MIVHIYANLRYVYHSFHRFRDKCTSPRYKRIINVKYTIIPTHTTKERNLYRNITHIGKLFAIVNPINFGSVRITEFYLT